MRAFAVFDGGGVKGAALAGCLAAAQQQNIEFVGYGGTSAGALVATLASAGYSGEEIFGLLKKDFHLRTFLDDGGPRFDEAKQLVAEVVAACGGKMPGLWGAWKIRSAAKRHAALIGQFSAELGLYDGKQLHFLPCCRAE